MPVLTTTGKNLFDGDFYFGQKYGINIKTIVGADNRTSASTVINVRPNTEYHIKPFNKLNGKLRFKGIMFYDANGDYLSETLAYGTAGCFVTPSNCHYITFEVQTSDWSEYTLDELKSQNYQIEEGSVATSYEPYKSNILTVNDPIELRGISEVKDELNLLTGEVTQRVGEVVLDGSEGWILSTTKDNTQVFNLAATSSKLKKVKKNGLIMCDKLKVASGVDEEIISFTSSLYIALLKSKVSTVEELKVYLSQNPITFIHELVAESIKTVDLPTLNKPYEGTNHYELTSDIPCEAILEVPVVSTGKQTLEEINN